MHARRFIVIIFRRIQFPYQLCIATFLIYNSSYKHKSKESVNISIAAEPKNHALVHFHKKHETFYTNSTPGDI